jgi:hypothetical protein
VRLMWKTARQTPRPERPEDPPGMRS